MPPELQAAMHRALTRGPGYCPPDLFKGSAGAIAVGLKMHSATIGEARYSALADTFPRTLALIGEDRFRELAERHLSRPEVLSQPLDEIGRGFPALLAGAAGSLARLEWAWLQSYRSLDRTALTLASLAGLSAEEIAALDCALHPAARLVPIASGAAIRFDGVEIDAPFALVTRPGAQVLVLAAGEQTTMQFELLRRPRSLGELLGADSDSATLLVRAGALTTDGGKKS